MPLNGAAARKGREEPAREESTARHMWDVRRARAEDTCDPPATAHRCRGRPCRGRPGRGRPGRGTVRGGGRRTAHAARGMPERAGAAVLDGRHGGGHLTCHRSASRLRAVRTGALAPTSRLRAAGPRRVHCAEDPAGRMSKFLDSEGSSVTAKVPPYAPGRRAGRPCAAVRAPGRPVVCRRTGMEKPAGRGARGAPRPAGFLDGVRIRPRCRAAPPGCPWSAAGACARRRRGRRCTRRCG